MKANQEGHLKLQISNHDGEPSQENIFSGMTTTSALSSADRNVVALRSPPEMRNNRLTRLGVSVTIPAPPRVSVSSRGRVHERECERHSWERGAPSDKYVHSICI
jgi:hypothetical protein